MAALHKHLRRHVGVLGLPGDVIDPASRKVVGRTLAENTHTELVADALTTALANARCHLPFRPGMQQYTSADYAEVVRANGMVISVGRKGECWDPAVEGRFWVMLSARQYIVRILDGWSSADVIVGGHTKMVSLCSAMPRPHGGLQGSGTINGCRATSSILRTDWS
jgi:transposase InsO family protein